MLFVSVCGAISKSPVQLEGIGWRFGGDSIPTFAYRAVDGAIH